MRHSEPYSPEPDDEPAPAPMSFGSRVVMFTAASVILAWALLGAAASAEALLGQ